MDMAPELPVLPTVPVTVQHPALSGTKAGVQAEIDHRTADPGAEPGAYRRVFLLAGAGYDRADHPAHLANAAETLGDATRRGLHPKGDVHLTGVAVRERRRSVETVLTYSVEVVPAVIDRDAASTLTPHDIAQED